MKMTAFVAHSSNQMVVISQHMSVSCIPNDIVLNPSYHTKGPDWTYCRVKGVGKQIMKVEFVQLPLVSAVWEDKHGCLRRELFNINALEGVDDLRGCGKTQLEERLKSHSITASVSPSDVCITPEELQSDPPLSPMCY